MRRKRMHGHRRVKRSPLKHPDDRTHHPKGNVPKDPNHSHDDHHKVMYRKEDEAEVDRRIDAVLDKIWPSKTKPPTDKPIKTTTK